MSARDWRELLLQTAISFPVLVVILFALRVVVTDLEPFSVALTGSGAFLGSAIGERWRRNRAAVRAVRLAEGAEATMQAGVKGSDDVRPRRWRWGRLHLETRALRWRPMYPPRSPELSWPLASVELLDVGTYRGWRRRVMAGFRVVTVRAGTSSFEIAVLAEDLPGLRSRLDQSVPST